jgi:hypothetical protein
MNMEMEMVDAVHVTSILIQIQLLLIIHIATIVQQDTQDQMWNQVVNHVQLEHILMKMDWDVNHVQVLTMANLQAYQDLHHAQFHMFALDWIQPVHVFALVLEPVLDQINAYVIQNIILKTVVKHLEFCTPLGYPSLVRSAMTSAHHIFNKPAHLHHRLMVVMEEFAQTQHVNAKVDTHKMEQLVHYAQQGLIQPMVFAMFVHLGQFQQCQDPQIAIHAYNLD